MPGYHERADSVDTPAKVKVRLKKLREKVYATTLGNPFQEDQADTGTKARDGEDSSDHQRSEGKRKTILIRPL